MIEVIEEVGDAPIVDVATDDDKLFLVVHLKAKTIWNDHRYISPLPYMFRYTLVCSPQFLQFLAGSLQKPRYQLEINFTQIIPLP